MSAVSPLHAPHKTHSAPPETRLAALRAELARRGLDGFLVPRADEHQGEYVPARAERLAWLTGFTGSAGNAVVLRDRAAVFVDGRYTLQVAAQVDDTLFARIHSADQTASEWIEANLPAGARLGYDPWLHTPNEVEKLKAAAEKAKGHLVAVEGNPLDAVWADQPAPPATPALPHDIAHAGVASADKRRQIAAELARAGVPASIATVWRFFDRHRITRKKRRCMLPSRTVPTS